MTVLYTNISPISLCYNNLAHFIEIKKNYNPKKIYICVWDSYVLEDERLKTDSINKTKLDVLKENVEVIEKIMKYLEMDYRIIYLSDAWTKLFKNKFISSIFQRILFRISVNDLVMGKELKYLVLEELNISKINYIIADYLICHFLKELYPELCETNPDNYVCIYTKIFERIIQDTMKKEGIEKFVKITSASIPIIISKKKGTIPAMNMQQSEIKNIVNDHIKNNTLNEAFIYDFFEILSNFLGETSFVDSEGNRISLNKLKEKKEFKNKKKLGDIISLNLIEYFNKVNEIVKNIKIEDKKETLYVRKYHEFDNYAKKLNSIKIDILKNCNGKNSSLDIAKLTRNKLSTISTYMSHLRDMGLITNDKKPYRKHDNLVINFETIEK